MLPYSPAVEAKFTIEPLPRATIAGSTARQATNAVVAFARNIASSSATRDLVERLRLPVAGAGDEAVDRAELVPYAGVEGLEALGVGGVERLRDQRRPVQVAPTASSASAARSVSAEPRALVGERLRDVAADAAARAGQDHRPPGEQAVRHGARGRTATASARTARP